MVESLSSSFLNMNKSWTFTYLVLRVYEIWVKWLLIEATKVFLHKYGLLSIVNWGGEDGLNEPKPLGFE